jgi:predicted O-methyltransferase YrrM
MKNILNFRNKNDTNIIKSFPLERSIANSFSKSVERSQNAQFIPHVVVDAQDDIPSPQTLKLYWGVLERVTRILGPHNIDDDRYYNWENFIKAFENGLVISKDLFGIWAAIHKRPRLILEIGTRTGKSLCNLMFAHGGAGLATMVLVDPFPEPSRLGSPDVVKRNLKHARIPTDNIYFLVGYSQKILPLFFNEFPDLKFDYVLVDGSHEKMEALEDLRIVSDHVAVGGYLVFDDLTATNLELNYSWNTWKNEHLNEFVFCEYSENYGFGVARKK